MTSFDRFKFGNRVISGDARPAPSGAKLDIALCQAIRNDDLLEALNLLGQGASPNSRDVNGVHCLDVSPALPTKPTPTIVIGGGSGEYFESTPRASFENHDLITCALLRSGATPTCSVRPLEALLQATVRAADPKSCELLLKSGVSVSGSDILSGLGKTNVSMSVGENQFDFSATSDEQFETLKLLVEAGADADPLSEGGTTPLFYFCHANFVPAIEFLLAHGADPLRVSQAGVTPLLQALAAGSAKAADTLLRRTACLQSSANASNQALFAAVSADNLELLTLLLNHGVSTSATNARGQSALFEARSAQIAAVLIDGGLDVNDAPSDGATPLMHASALGRLAVVEVLLNKGADVNIETDLGLSAMHYSVPRYGTILTYPGSPIHISIMRLLVQRGADVNVETRDSETPLMLAAGEAFPDVVEFLLSAGADPRAARADGGTALHFACDPQNQWSRAFDTVDRLEQVIALLLKHGADPNAIVDGGVAPLHLAARGFAADIVKSLLNGGSDPALRSEDDLTPLSAACKGGWTEVVQALAQACRDRSQQRELDEALLETMKNSNPRVEVLQCLVEAGANPCWEGPTGHSALSLSDHFPNRQEYRSALTRGEEHT